jgi:hypothetical protein
MGQGKKMRLVVSNKKTQLKSDERAFLVQLAALNTAIESARAGQPEFGRRALAVEQLMERYFQSLTAEQRTN